MKMSPYRQTSKGIRIPKRRNKWMSPVSAEAHEYEDIVPVPQNVPLNLYVRSLNLLLALKSPSHPTDIIDLTDWQQGGEQGGV